MEKDEILERIRLIESIRTSKRSSEIVQLYMGKEKVQNAHIAMIKLGNTGMTLVEFARRAVDIETKRLLSDMTMEDNNKTEYNDPEKREMALKTELLECKAEKTELLKCKAELEKLKNFLENSQRNIKELLTAGKEQIG